MKKNNFLIIAALVILILLGLWYFLPNNKNNNENYQIVNCEQNGGQWLDNKCMISPTDIVSPEELVDSAKELEASCLAAYGIWLNDDEFSCEIDGVTYPHGSWEMIEEKYSSCLEHQGAWLGGIEFACEIDEKIYNGNWEQVMVFKNSCQDLAGVWLAGDNNECSLDGQVYTNGTWNKLSAMKDSCLQYGGEFLAGPDFECQIYDDVYKNNEWVRVAVAPSIGEKCEADGGTWLPEYQECEGLPLDWCIQTESEFAGIKGLKFEDCVSPCRHFDTETCIEVCVPVCEMNM